MEKMESNAHPSGIPQNIVDKVVKRRGRLHAFPTLNPSKTGLVVVDLDTRSLEEPYNGRIRKMAEKVNALAATLRVHGGTVAWGTTPIRKASSNFIAIYGEDFAKMHEDASVVHGAATTVWHGLDTQHKATLATFFRNFGDVRPTHDVMDLIEQNRHFEFKRE